MRNICWDSPTSNFGVSLANAERKIAVKSLTQNAPDLQQKILFFDACDAARSIALRTEQLGEPVSRRFQYFLVL